MGLFANKALLIAGGTGSFGNTVLNRFLRTDIGEIRIFSRDEKKQDDMRHEFQTKMPEVADKIKFYIGDVCNLESCRGAMNGVDYIWGKVYQISGRRLRTLVPKSLCYLFSVREMFWAVTSASQYAQCGLSSVSR